MAKKLEAGYTMSHPDLIDRLEDVIEYFELEPNIELVYGDGETAVDHFILMNVLWEIKNAIKDLDKRVKDLE